MATSQSVRTQYVNAVVTAALDNGPCSFRRCRAVQRGANSGETLPPGFKHGMIFEVVDRQGLSKVKNCVRLSQLHALFRQDPITSGSRIFSCQTFLQENRRQFQRGLWVHCEFQNKKHEHAFQRVLLSESELNDTYIKYIYDDQFEMFKWHLMVCRTEEFKEVDSGGAVQILPLSYHPAFLLPKNSLLFGSVEDALDVLQEVNSKESSQLLGIVRHALDRCDSKGQQSPATFNHPFVVIEGLDGTGKSTLAKSLSEVFGATMFHSPPDELMHLRPHFDSQPDLIRRAYYTAGNYLVATSIEKELKTTPIIMDRFWHSTAAYTMATECNTWGIRGLPPRGHWSYIWPSDLLRPTMTLYLCTTEEIRSSRLTGRNTAVTNEESQLRMNRVFRETLDEAYRRMENPGVTELEVSASREDVRKQAVDWLRPLFKI